jgi:hypothetical protein
LDYLPHRYVEYKKTLTGVHGKGLARQLCLAKDTGPKGVLTMSLLKELLPFM